MLKQVLDIWELLDSARVTGADVRDFLRARGAGDDEVAVTRIEGAAGGTDFLRVVVPGTAGRRAGGPAPTLGVIGRLGGIGARPAVAGMVSDADGAIVVLAVATKLLDMRRAGDRLTGDVVMTTHVCPCAPIEPHEPVPFMGAPVDMATMNAHEVRPEMEAVLSVDTTKGNRVINARGFAISPTVKEGWILRVSEDLLDVMALTTGEPPRVFPVTTQDITPYGNGVYHLNSILQPACATAAPVVGVAVTTVTPVPGPATGASHEVDVAAAARFVLEAARGYGLGRVSFYDSEEFARLVGLYGSMRRLQQAGPRPL
ncbi:MAG: DUF1177 domain-containing protein [Bacillota bacterium]